MAKRRRKNPSDVFMSHLEDLLSDLNKISQMAGKLASHAPKDAPWIGSYLDEIAEKTDDLGARLEEELEESGLI